MSEKLPHLTDGVCNSFAGRIQEPGRPLVDTVASPVARWARATVTCVRSRWRKIAVAVCFVAALVTQGFFHWADTRVGRPYENWDEIANYTTAYVIGDDYRTYRYGSLHTSLQLAAVVWHDYLDPVGRKFPHIRYSNNVPASWNDPYLSYGEKTWVGVDYNYFRGTDDRQAIFLSRQLHLTFAYAIILILGALAIRALNESAAFIIVPLLVLTVAPEQYFQLTQSLPTGINAVLAFGCVFFAMLFCLRLQVRDLVLSAACLAIGLNFKVTIVTMAAAPGLAIVYALWRRGFTFAVKSGLIAAVCAGVLFIVTAPSVVFAPIQACAFNIIS